MFGPGQLMTALSPPLLHSSAAHLFPAFPTRLSSPPILLPGPLFGYELLRSYLQPEPCKQALLLASQAAGLSHLSETVGEYQSPSLIIVIDKDRNGVCNLVDC